MNRLKNMPRPQEPDVPTPMANPFMRLPGNLGTPIDQQLGGHSIVFGIAWFNFPGLVTIVIGGGVAMILGMWLERLATPIFSILLWCVNFGALIAGLLGVAYDRHGGLGLWESWNRYAQLLMLGRGSHPGRLAYFGLPVAWLPLLMFVSFLLGRVLELFPGLTTAHAIQFLAASAVVSVVCVPAQAVAKMHEDAEGTRR